MTRFTNSALHREGRRLVLNAGSGPPSSRSLHLGFTPEEWDVLRLDIDPDVQPDVVGSISDMQDLFEDSAFDAVWSSHNIEHLYAHEVVPALAEFRPVLKSYGFLLVTCPDLESVVQAFMAGGLDHVTYMSPMGPITVHDMMFGHGGAIAAGAVYMAHKTAFTRETLGAAALSAGFAQARVGRDAHYNLWALVRLPESDLGLVERSLQTTNVEFLLEFSADEKPAFS